MDELEFFQRLLEIRVRIGAHMWFKHNENTMSKRITHVDNALVLQARPSSVIIFRSSYNVAVRHEGALPSFRDRQVVTTTEEARGRSVLKVIPLRLFRLHKLFSVNNVEAKDNVAIPFSMSLW